MKKVFKIAGFSLLGFFVLLVIISIFVPKEELEKTRTDLAKKNEQLRSQPTESPPVSQVEVPPPVPVKSEFEKMMEKAVHSVHVITLVQEYKDNEFAADEKYKGKIILVRGNITEFADTLGVPSIQLETNQMLTGMTCSMKKSQRPLLAKLSKGQDVLVVGELTGMSLGISIGMKDCLVGLAK